MYHKSSSWWGSCIQPYNLLEYITWESLLRGISTSFPCTFFHKNITPSKVRFGDLVILKCLQRQMAGETSLFRGVQAQPPELTSIQETFPEVAWNLNGACQRGELVWGACEECTLAGLSCFPLTRPHACRCTVSPAIMVVRANLLAVPHAHSSQPRSQTGRQVL